MTTPAPARRRWFRISLRTFFVLFLVFGSVLGYYCHLVRVQQEIIEHSSGLGGFVTWSYQYRANGDWADVLPLPATIVEFLGRERLFRLREVVVEKKSPEAALSQLRDLTNRLPWHVDVCPILDDNMKFIPDGQTTR